MGLMSIHRRAITMVVQALSSFGSSRRGAMRIEDAGRPVEGYALDPAVRRDGATLVPLSIFFNPRGIAKVSIGLAEGRKKSDKREAIKERDWQRDKARLMSTRAKGRD